MEIGFNRENLRGFLSEGDFENLLSKIEEARRLLLDKKGKGAEFTGWVELPSQIKDSFLNELKKLGEEVRKNSDCVISIGIGGSYLGIRATVEFLSDGKAFPIYYAGHNLNSDYLYNLLEGLKKKRVSVVVISKSGTTTEPAIAFRIVKKFLESKYKGKELQKRIICVTDEKKGALLKIAQKEGYRTFVIPDDVGGRFSIFSPVGLVPLAIAGIDIKKLISGARRAQQEFTNKEFSANPALQYAAARHLLYQKGKTIE